MYRKTVLALSLLLSTLSVSASTYVPIVRCGAPSTGLDHSLGVRIDRFRRNPILSRPNFTGLVATIFEDTSGNEREVAKFIVHQQQTSAIGAARFYLGRDFELKIFVDAAPSSEGIPAHLTAEVRGARVSEDLVCSFAD